MWSYKTNTKLSLPVKVAGKRVRCDFSDGNYFYHTINEDIKKAIEASIYFKNGTVQYSGRDVNEVEVAPVVNEEVKELKVEEVVVGIYDNITTIQQAKDVLRAEPFNVPFQSLNTPANILKKAEELGVTFPKL